MNTTENVKTFTDIAGNTIELPADCITITDPGPYTVYELISPKGKVYVGKTVRPVKDRWNYGCDYRFNHDLNADIHTMGWENFQKNIIAENVSKEQAELKERLAIKLRHAKIPHGYNVRDGGDSGYAGPNCRPVNQIDLATGTVIRRWPSMHAAERALNIWNTHICDTVKGQRKSAGGFGWQYADQTDTTHHEGGEA